MATNLTIYTDRSQFNKEVGTYTSLTLNNPAINDDPSTDSYKATYGNLITFTFDRRNGVGVNGDGTVTLGRTTLAARGTVLQSATAFGFDIVSAGTDSRGMAHFTVAGNELNIPLSGISFLGVVSTTPIEMSVHYYLQYSGIGGFTMKDVAIQIPPPKAPQGLKVW